MKPVLTAVALVALASATLFAIQIASADDKLVCLPPAVVLALS